MAHVLDVDSHVIATLREIARDKSKGQQRERRWFHPFPARMPQSIVEHLVGSLTHPEAVVLDPMVGSGSTLVGAKTLGRTSIGFDCDELATYIARTAVQSFSQAELEEAGKRISRRARDAVYTNTFRLPTQRKRLPSEDQEFLKYWFPSRAQKELFTLASAVSEEEKAPIREFAWVVFSSLIIAKQAGASYAMDISRSRPHRREDQPITWPFDAWPIRFQRAVPLRGDRKERGIAKALPFPLLPPIGAKRMVMKRVVYGEGSPIKLQIQCQGLKRYVDP